MTDDKPTATQMAMIQEIVADIIRRCTEEHGFEAPFEIDITDATGFNINASLIPDPKMPTRLKLYGVKAPTDEHGNIVPEPKLVFPLKVSANDHTGRVYEGEIHTRH